MVFHEKRDTWSFLPAGASERTLSPFTGILFLFGFLMKNGMKMPAFIYLYYQVSPEAC